MQVHTTKEITKQPTAKCTSQNGVADILDAGFLFATISKSRLPKTLSLSLSKITNYIRAKRTVT